ncbi:pentatricopeptide repeat-containing protein At2g13600-like [Typha latifolia]|uniref:pentatricopeptide repeat-containing protein At2g13600-like n=1 Tax=Typha latifolia TaxID=4733 RepID=UPI003C2DA2EE
MVCAFRSIRCSDDWPDQFGFAMVLSGPARLVSLDFGRQVHCDVTRTGFGSNSFCEASLNDILDMYAKSGELNDAKAQLELSFPIGIESILTAWHSKFNPSSNHFVGSSLVDFLCKTWGFGGCQEGFLKMPARGILPRNALIAGLVQNDSKVEAFDLFSQMQAGGLRPSYFTFASILPACMYMKSEMLEDANKLFVEMPGNKIFKELKNKENAISWNSMIVGFAHNGYVKEALSTFQKMQESLKKPDDITFLDFLAACTHAEAQELIDELAFESDSMTWSTFLAACRMHRDEIRWKLAAAKLNKLEPDNSSHYVLLSNLYAASGNWVEANIGSNARKRDQEVTWLLLGYSGSYN